MNNKISLALSVLSLALLQACGGGGGDSQSANTLETNAPPTNGAPTQTNTGSVTAAFVRGDLSRYLLAGVGSQISGRLTTSVQAEGGAMTTLNSNVLSGTTSVREINGNGSYAMGRWAAGTVVTSTGARTLTGTDNQAYHYIAFNALGALPVSGSATCDAGVFTAPTYSGGGTSTVASGSASGSATLAFGATGAIVGGTVNVTASGSGGSAPLSTTIPSPTSAGVTGAYLSSGTGAYVQIGDAGSNAYVVVTSYVATLANGARYIGVARFRCS